jgi:hypothetical protein
MKHITCNKKTNLVLETLEIECKLQRSTVSYSCSEAPQQAEF